MIDNESLTRESRRNVKFYDESGRARSFSDSNDASIIQRVSFTLARIDEYVCVFVTRVFLYDWAKRGKNDRSQVQKLRFTSFSNQHEHSTLRRTLTNYSAN